MDPVTHLAAGTLGGQAVRNPLHRDRYFLFFCIIAGWLPDIDNVVGFLGMEFYLAYHRGFTHSLLGGLLLAAILVGIFRIWITSFPLLRGFLLAYACILVHIFLDLMTSYGTEIFFPFTHTRYSIPSVFIIDPFYTLIMVFLAYKSLRSIKKRKTMALIGLCWIFLYPAISLSIRYTFQAHLTAELKHEGMVFDKMTVTTDVLSPFFWKVIVEDPTSYQVGGVSLFHPNQPIEFTRYTKADRTLLQQLGKQAPLFNTYAWFTEYTVMRAEKSGHETAITFSDVKFSSAVPFLRKLRDQGERSFAITAVLDEHQKLLRYSYYEHGRGKTIEQVK